MCRPPAVVNETLVANETRVYTWEERGGCCGDTVQNTTFQDHSLFWKAVCALPVFVAMIFFLVDIWFHESRHGITTAAFIRRSLKLEVIAPSYIQEIMSLSEDDSDDAAATGPSLPQPPALAWGLVIASSP